MTTPTKKRAEWTIDGVIPPHIPEGASCLYWIFPTFSKWIGFPQTSERSARPLSAEEVKGASHVPYYFFPDSIEYLPFDRMSSRREDMAGALKYISRTIRWVWNGKYSGGDIENRCLAIKKVADYFRK